MWVCSFGVPNCPICPCEDRGRHDEADKLVAALRAASLRFFSGENHARLLRLAHSDDAALRVVLDVVKDVVGHHMVDRMTEEGRKRYERLMGPSAEDVLEEAKADRELDAVMHACRHHHHQPETEEVVVGRELLEAVL